MKNKEGWIKKKLGEVCQIKGGGTPSKDNLEFYNGDIPWATVRDMSSNYVSDTEFSISEEAVKQSSTNIYPAGTVIIASRVGLGKVSYLTKPTAINQDLKALFPNKSISTNFLFYWLKSKTGFIISNGVGATVKGVKLSFLNSLEIPIPALPIQHQIVSELDALSDIITKKKQQLEELDKLAQATFYDMFGDPVSNEKGWEVKKLGNLCEVGSSKRVFINELVESGIPFYRGTEIGQLSVGKEIKPELFITSEHYNRLKEQTGVPQIGDLLMPSICPDGRILRVSTSEPFYFKDGRVLWIKVNNNKINSLYLKTLLKEIFFVDYSKIASGSTFAELKIFALKGITLPLPSITKQTQFAEKIDSIEKQKSLIKKSIDDVQQLFDYTMDKYFN